MNGNEVNGAFTNALDGAWTLAAAGDFNGDGKTDLLWRHASGLNAVWQMDGATVMDGAFTNSLDSAWTSRPNPATNGQ